MQNTRKNLLFSHFNQNKGSPKKIQAQSFLFVTMEKKYHVAFTITLIQKLKLLKLAVVADGKVMRIVAQRNKHL